MKWWLPKPACHWWTLGFLCGLLCPLPLPAQTADSTPPTESSSAPALSGLNIGHPAPPLMVEQWYSGPPIAKLVPGQVYVNEFWATWCEPCRACIPHLSELQSRYGDKVHLIGITSEDAETINSFLAENQSADRTWKEAITYRLAQDRDGMTTQTYVRAAGLKGIPQAFIVGRDGVIDWIGHPKDMDEPLAKVVDGTWDRAEAVALLELERRLTDLTLQFHAKANVGEWDAALDLLTRMQTLANDEQQVHEIRLKRLSILQRAGRGDEAAALRSQLIESAWNNAAELNSMAWNIALVPGERDLATALKMAQRAAELSHEQDASILHTLARIHSELGHLDQAIRWQTVAVALTSGDPTYAVTLRRYQQQAKQLDDPHSH
jgi:thiol-disulfide isomerase/thioredoxin